MAKMKKDYTKNLENINKFVAFCLKGLAKTLITVYYPFEN